jgi:hypothetical protein
MTTTGTRFAIWPYLGFLAMALGYVATWTAVFLVSEDDLEAGGSELIDALDTSTNELLYRITSGMGILAAALLVIFAVNWRRLLDERSGGQSAVPRIIEIGFLATAFALTMGMIFRAMVFDTALDYYAGTAVGTLVGLGVDVPLASWGALGLAAGAAAYGALKEKILPTWFGWVSVIVVVLDVLLALSGTPFPMNFPGGVWLLLASIIAVSQASQGTDEVTKPATH